MVSVFDIEEVGHEVLMTELELDEPAAQQAVEIASTRAKEVAIQQQKDKEEKERLARENAAAAQKLLAGEGVASGDEAASAILGLSTAPTPAAAPSTEGDDRAKDILGQ
jgi:hypothetical protein